MIKGIQKQMVMVRTNDSPLFETAYFVLRDGLQRDHGDIVTEANRLVAGIISEKQPKPSSKRSSTKRNTVPFVIGLLCGVSATLIAVLALKFI